MKILYEVCVVLVVPMFLAFIVKHCFHRFHRWVTGVKDLSYYLWGCSLTIVTGTTVKNIVHADTSVGFILIIALLGLFALHRTVCYRVVCHRPYFDATVEADRLLKNTALPSG